MRRSLTTLAAIAALTALPATAHANRPPVFGDWFDISNNPDTGPNLGRVPVTLPDAVPFPTDDIIRIDPIDPDIDIEPIE
jgi:hypothetical protein